jgi:large subunit ribosomal protein L32
MAVQKSRKSKSKKGMRRSHHGLSGPSMSVDKTTGVRHLRHHIAKDGYYMGNEVIAPKEREARRVANLVKS